MPELALKRAGGIAYREAAPSEASDGSPALCLHGWPQSSYMWRHLLPAIASAGRRALALDFAGFGDSRPIRLEPSSDVSRRSAVPQPDRTRTARPGRPRHRRSDRPALGMRPPGRRIRPRDHQHGILPRPRVDRDRQDDANPDPGRGARRQPLPRGIHHITVAETSTKFDDRALDEYWKAFSTAEGARHARALSLLRSRRAQAITGQARCARAAHTLILWGQQDEYLPVDYASRFASQIPHSRLGVLLEGVRHFSSTTSRSAAPTR